MGEEFRQRPPKVVAEACDRIERLTGVRRQATQVRLLLRERLGLRWRKVVAIPVPPQKSVEEHAATQAAFLKDGAGTAAGRSASRAANRLVRRCGSLRAGVVFGLGLVTPVTLVLDNDAYQRCQLVQDLARQLNSEVLFLPAYSPHLNLIERLWKFVKKQALHSRHHTNYADFQTALDSCLDQLATTHKPAVASLLTLHFQTFQHVPMLSA